MNQLILLFHITAICGITLLALRLGRETALAWLSTLCIAMNLFLLKQVTLFGLNVTPSDALAVGYLLALNLIQEFFGQTSAKKGVWLSFFLLSSFCVLSHLHLLYQPNVFDLSQPHFEFLFKPFPRLIFASLASFLVVQLLDLSFFALLRRKTAGKYLAGRILLSLLFAQVLDTLLFSFLGLYGVVAALGDVILLSLLVKCGVVFLSIPFVSLAKRWIRHDIPV